MVQKISQPIEGTWLPFKAELAGAQAPAMALAQMKLVIGKGKYAVYFGGEVTDAGSYLLGVEAEVQTITLTGKRGTNAGSEIPSIFQLVGDRLRICFGLGGIRPGTFSTTIGSSFYLVTYKRQNGTG